VHPHRYDIDAVRDLDALLRGLPALGHQQRRLGLPNAPRTRMIC
jgi:hypothetical protein